MKTQVKSDENVKMNLTVPKEFADLLTTKANNDYMKTATWVKRFLMQRLLPKGNNETEKSMNQNGRTMEN